MKNIFNRFLNKKEESKLQSVIDRLELLTKKIEVQIDTSLLSKETEKKGSTLNINRRFILETGNDGYNHTTWIAIRDRGHKAYKSNRNDVSYEDDDVVYYAKSIFNGNNYFISYHTPSENVETAREIEFHLNALERLGVLRHFIVKKE